MKPHKWAKEIIHFVNGGEVECKFYDGDEWFTVNSISDFDYFDAKFRIKPKKKTMSVAVFRKPSGETYVSGEHVMYGAERLGPWTAIEYEDNQS